MSVPTRTVPAATLRPARRGWPLRIGLDAWLVIAITLLAAALRLITLADQSLWLDETQAVHEVSLSFSGMWHSWSQFEGNPPLYLLIAWPWAKVFGTSAYGLRSLSAVLGIGLVPIVYLAGRELVSSRAGLVAALFTAVNPFMIWYSQEAREYMLLVTASAASLLFFARAWRQPTRRRLVWWVVFSALALLSQYFTGFLVAAEGLALIIRWRSRGTVVALAALGVLEAALVPHSLSLLAHPTEFIVSFPLSLRIQQVPVSFAMNTLYESGIVSYGLIGAAVLAGAMIVLLIVGAEERELRGAGLAAALAGSVLLGPLVFALLGHDDYIARNLMSAWAPLVIAAAAACTARGARLAGGALAVVLVAVFVYAGIRIETQPQFQKPDWRGVAAALGRASGPREIVTYDGVFASAPLSIYLPRVPWSGPGMAPVASLPVRVSEVDVVGSTSQQLISLPAGVHLISSLVVDGYRVVRFGLTPAWTLTPAEIGARASTLLGPGPPQPTVILQGAPGNAAVS